MAFETTGYGIKIRFAADPTLTLYAKATTDPFLIHFGLRETRKYTPKI